MNELEQTCTPSEAALRQLFSRQLFWYCVLLLNGRMALNTTVSHESLSQMIVPAKYEYKPDKVMGENCRCVFQVQNKDAITD